MINESKNARLQKISRWVGKFLITGGLYYLFGKIGSLLTIQPGHFSVLWVPAGFALGAIILFKWPAVFAVLLSVLLVILDTFTVQNSVPLSLALTLLLTLQAFAGAELMRKKARLIPPD
ncbi:hypothetical protein EG832_06775, partial [bacterium]|nr:hypothetical protein [bacterium]